MKNTTIFAIILIAIMAMFIVGCAAQTQITEPPIYTPPKSPGTETQNTVTDSNDLNLVTEEDTDIGEMI